MFQSDIADFADGCFSSKMFRWMGFPDGSTPQGIIEIFTGIVTGLPQSMQTCTALKLVGHLNHTIKTGSLKNRASRNVNVVYHAVS